MKRIILLLVLTLGIASCNTSLYKSNKADWFKGKIEHSILVDISGIPGSNKNETGYKENLGKELLNNFNELGIKSEVTNSDALKHPQINDFSYSLILTTESYNEHGGFFIATLYHVKEKKNVWKTKFFGQFSQPIIAMVKVSTAQKNSKKGADYVIKKLKQDGLL